jgi:hypothetical protein
MGNLGFNYFAFLRGMDMTIMEKIRSVTIQILFCSLFCISLIFLSGFGGYTEVSYEGASPKGTYRVKVTKNAGPSEKYSTWSMDILRDKEMVISDRKMRPFYAWTCINRGKAIWQTDSVLQFTNFSCEGRHAVVHVENNTQKTIPYAEIWLRSVDDQGYPHSPSILFIFDIPPGAKWTMKHGVQLFSGAEYFRVNCEHAGKKAASIYEIPTDRSAPHHIDLGSRHKITVKLAGRGPVLNGGAFHILTEEQIKARVPEEVIPLIETTSKR